MTLPMTTDAIFSRPRYAVLAPRPCTGALMIADDAGMAALMDLAAKAPDLIASAVIVHLRDDRRPDPDWSAGGPRQVIACAAMADLGAAIAQALAGAGMGLRAWLAGSEGLIGLAQAHLLAAGLPLGAIQAEHRGSAARPVQCVHCKTRAEDVTTDPCRCPGCGRALYVRDHFSRRLGAFQGVCIDAETPGEVPEPVEIRL